MTCRNTISRWMERSSEHCICKESFMFDPQWYVLFTQSADNLIIMVFCQWLMKYTSHVSTVSCSLYTMNIPTCWSMILFRVRLSSKSLNHAYWSLILHFPFFIIFVKWNLWKLAKLPHALCNDIYVIVMLCACRLCTGEIKHMYPCFIAVVKYGYEFGCESIK